MRGVELGRFGPNSIRPSCLPGNGPGFTFGPSREACKVLDLKKPSSGGPRVNPSVSRVFETTTWFGYGSNPKQGPSKQYQSRRGNFRTLSGEDKAIVGGAVDRVSKHRRDWHDDNQNTGGDKSTRSGRPRLTYTRLERDCGGRKQ